MGIGQLQGHKPDLMIPTGCNYKLERNTSTEGDISDSGVVQRHLQPCG